DAKQKPLSHDEIKQIAIEAARATDKKQIEELIARGDFRGAWAVFDQVELPDGNKLPYLWRAMLVEEIAASLGMSDQVPPQYQDWHGRWEASIRSQGLAPRFYEHAYSAQIPPVPRDAAGVPLVDPEAIPHEPRAFLEFYRQFGSRSAQDLQVRRF